MQNWFPMHMAPRNGMPFVYLERITVVGAGKPPQFRFTLHAVRRAGEKPETAGYWTNSVVSRSDHEMQRGWWAYSTPVNVDGSLKLPDDAHAA